MNSFAVFLRGINVGGINIKMADLRTALAALELESFSTLLATGNIVCSTALAADALKTAVEECLRANFGYDAWVVVLDGGRVAELVAAAPYPPDSAENHCYITLASDPAALDRLLELAAAAGEESAVRIGSEAIAWLAPVGGTLDSPFSKVSSKATFRATTTTRNLRTLIKIRDALEPK
jgi:uncharacterized protein (DUF1697 family)